MVPLRKIYGEKMQVRGYGFGLFDLLAGQRLDSLRGGGGKKNETLAGSPA